MAVLDERRADRGGQMRLACSARAEEQDVGTLFEPCIAACAALGSIPRRVPDRRDGPSLHGLCSRELLPRNWSTCL